MNILSRNRLRLMPLWLLLCATALFAQTKPDINRYSSGQLPTSRLNAPGIAGLCLQTDGAGGVSIGTCSAGGGSGTVTTFSAGNLSPLFTATVTNPTTTPSLAFTLSNITGHKFLGNNTSGTAAPTFIQPATTDLADFSPTAPTTSGKVPIFDQPSGTYIPGDPLVQGLVSDGSTTAENPVAIGGYDTAGTPGLHRATFINGAPGGTEYGIVTRNIPSGTQAVSGSVSVSNFPATQAVSGTVAATQSGTWTVQPGNTANTTAWKVDGSAVTQPVSVAATVNVQGAKTNNNAAPGATNIGTLPGIANAASPSFTEGNQGALSFDLKGNLRVNGRPPDVVGCYQVNGRTSTYSGLSAGAPLFSFRWGDATHLAIINHVKVQVIATVAATTAGQAEREIIIARSFTASDTGGTAVTLTGNNQKLRTSFGTSLVTDMRFGTTITAGTRTLDANPIASAVAWLPLNMTGVDIGCSGASPTGAVWSCVSSSGYIDLLNTSNNQDYPLILAQNEGFIVRVGKDAMPAGATQQTYVTAAWCEVNSY